MWKREGEKNHLYTAREVFIFKYMNNCEQDENELINYLSIRGNKVRIYLDSYEDIKSLLTSKYFEFKYCSLSMLRKNILKSFLMIIKAIMI